MGKIIFEGKIKSMPSFCPYCGTKNEIYPGQDEYWIYSEEVRFKYILDMIFEVVFKCNNCDCKIHSFMKQSKRINNGVLQ